MPDKGGATLSPKRRLIIANRTEGYIIKHLPDFIEALEKLAMGVLVEKIDGRSGETSIYSKPPDRQALEFLIEHGLGKVPQRNELTGPEGGPLEIVAWSPPVIEKSKPQLTDGSTLDAEARGSASEEETQEAEEGEDG